MLKHIEEDYNKLKNSYKQNNSNTSLYWLNYVKDICEEIERNGFKNYGSNYKLTSGGFGDTPKISPRPSLRRLFKIPIIYKYLEKKYVYYVIKKTKLNYFNHLKNDDFSKVDLLEHIAKKIHYKTLKSTVVRRINIDKFEIPASYSKGAVYLDIIEKIIDFYKLPIKINNLFESNVIDIGGGIGSIVHSFYEFNSLHNFNPKANFILLDQFPVSYIGKQNLEYFSGQKVFLYNKSERELISKSKLSVIQSSNIHDYTNLNVSFFFNSSSFQEMDISQVEEYCDFIKNNAAQNAYLACFLYPSNKKENSDKAVVEILNTNFELLGWDKNYFDKYGGAPGILYLYSV